VYNVIIKNTIYSGNEFHTGTILLQNNVGRHPRDNAGLQVFAYGLCKYLTCARKLIWIVI